MKWTIFLGTPRGRKSNSHWLLHHLLQGFKSIPDSQYEVVYLQQIRRLPQQVELFKQAQAVLLWVPLYTDAMPGNVKLFIDALSPLRGSCTDKTLAFVIQSGFMEAAHSRPLQAYFEKLTQRLGARYAGTLVKGSAEGLLMQPAWITRKPARLMRALGKQLALTGQWDEALANKLAGKEHLGPMQVRIIHLMGRLGLMNGYWNYLLKKNKAHKKRFAQPYRKID